ncbi:glycosyltransferase family A protein [Pseudoalteromonas sp. Hal099]
MESALPSVYLRWHLNTQPLVSIIIPTRNGLALVKGCIESILNKTTYSNYEILLIDNGSDDPKCLKYFNQLSKHSKIKVLNYCGRI